MCAQKADDAVSHAHGLAHAAATTGKTADTGRISAHCSVLRAPVAQYGTRIRVRPQAGKGSLSAIYRRSVLAFAADIFFYRRHRAHFRSSFTPPHARRASQNTHSSASPSWLGERYRRLPPIRNPPRCRYFALSPTQGCFRSSLTPPRTRCASRNAHSRASPSRKRELSPRLPPIRNPLRCRYFALSPTRGELPRIAQSSARPSRITECAFTCVPELARGAFPSFTGNLPSPSLPIFYFIADTGRTSLRFCHLCSI